MTRIFTNAALAAIAFVSCFAASASAESYAPSVGGDPSTWGPVEDHEVPAFGFWANLAYGYGYQVTGVNSYSAARRFGLEQGDIIAGVTIDGSYHSLANGGWKNVVSRAMHYGGHMKLHVMDVNTGFTVTRWTNTYNW